MELLMKWIMKKAQTDKLVQNILQPAACLNESKEDFVMVDEGLSEGESLYKEF